MYAGGSSDKDDKMSNMEKSSTKEKSTTYKKPAKKKSPNHHGSTHKVSDDELPPIVKGPGKGKKGKYNKTAMFPPFKKSKVDHNKYVSPYQKKKVHKTYSLYKA